MRAYRLQKMAYKGSVGGLTNGMFIPCRNKHYAAFKLHSEFLYPIISIERLRYVLTLSELFHIWKTDNMGDCCKIQQDEF